MARISIRVAEVVVGLARIVERTGVRVIMKLATSEENLALDASNRIRALVSMDRVNHLVPRVPQAHRKTVDRCQTTDFVLLAPKLTVIIGSHRLLPRLSQASGFSDVQLVRASDPLLSERGQ